MGCVPLVRVCHVGAGELLKKQSTEASMFISGADGIIAQLLFDEAKLQCMAQNAISHTKRDVCLLASHGRLLSIKRSGAGEASSCSSADQELVLPIVAMQENSAACMLSALQKALPPDIAKLLHGEVPAGVEAVALIAGIDSYGANVMLMQHLANVQDATPECDKVFVLTCFCNQHRTGTTMATLVKKMACLSPLFCVSKLMRASGYRKRFERGVKHYVKKHLILKDSTFQQLEEDKRQAVAILDMFYPELPDEERNADSKRGQVITLISSRIQPWVHKSISFYNAARQGNCFWL